MITFAPFELSDLDLLEVQPRHTAVYEMFQEIGHARLERLLVGRYSWTAWTAYGVPVAACGILYNGSAWAILAPDLRRFMLPITRKVRTVLEQHAAERGDVVAHIDRTHLEASRWAGKLGFEPDGHGVHPAGGPDPHYETWRFRA
ncbi:hypothetical protein [uncultured Rhodospira sp.]|uniref:hypothetical protein n=1 Tax=uncultured Rhodospira sp. TaxID=1936189 RepID=UPI002630A5A9|nr:hypothetical protein [uncultured Rhodospira sp.]